MQHIKAISVVKAQEEQEDLYQLLQYVFDFVLTLVETKGKQGYPS